MRRRVGDHPSSLADHGSVSAICCRLPQNFHLRARNVETLLTDWFTFVHADQLIFCAYAWCASLGRDEGPLQYAYSP